MSEERREFAITFIHWEKETGENPCDWCDKEQTRWYCDALCEGYCEKCFKENTEEPKGAKDSYWYLIPTRQIKRDLLERFEEEFHSISENYFDEIHISEFEKFKKKRV